MSNTSRTACISPTQSAVRKLANQRGLAARIALWLIQRHGFVDGREIGLEATDFAIREHYSVSERTARRLRAGEAAPLWRVWQIYADAVKHGLADEFLRVVFAEAWAKVDARILQLQAEHEETRRRLAAMEADLERSVEGAARDRQAAGREGSAGGRLCQLRIGADLGGREQAALTSLAAALGTGPAAWWHRWVAPLLWRAA